MKRVYFLGRLYVKLGKKKYFCVNTGKVVNLHKMNVQVIHKTASIAFGRPETRYVNAGNNIVTMPYVINKENSHIQFVGVDKA